MKRSATSRDRAPQMAVLTFPPSRIAAMRCLKRWSGNILFLIRFVASTLGSAASTSFMPQSSNRAIKEKKRDGE